MMNIMEFFVSVFRQIFNIVVEQPYSFFGLMVLILVFIQVVGFVWMLLRGA